MDNDYYAITFFDEDDKFKHIIIPVKLYKKHSETKTEYWNIYGLLDTGATISGITKKIAAKMGLEPDGTDEFLSLTGTSEVNTYHVDVFLPYDKLIENLKVVEISDDHSHDFLIGMDIIRMGDMAITNAGGKLVFSFRIPPAEKHIDFEYDMLKARNPNEEIEPLFSK